MYIINASIHHLIASKSQSIRVECKLI